jgi:hypothetical protein
MTDYPITPPPELVKQWIKECDQPDNPRWQEYEQDIATRAAQWGADQELKACCDHMRDHQWGFVDLPDGTKIHRAIYLQQTRRPKPQSLKQQALDELHISFDRGYLKEGAADTIRRALEQLPD